ncbi:tRNA uridine-5-carboxymethylaminomethyl(34) synthesis GTPase MnmE [Biomaibacter acetigenes]|jgi:tRNA modification GTPase|uniref:tRNA modification GTPase MnmE n=1 Tax=Biomaibacter acetigenes TaxID=2316383 RepID=A0A3G2R9T2_9FIRM|nr:tRNA uridine-5-carboxymethylaminomethyl(34) synthesis GTPase MnmE [Biomaibacter acetigenes]
MRVKDEDTIAAISTPLGEGGIGIVRISGEKSFDIARRIFSPKSEIKNIKSRYLYLGQIIDPEEGYPIDEVLTAFFKAPNTYTREDMVEINCHGGMTAQRKILELTIRYGARVAEPGEFTKRAFLNGRIDLSQAEAVIDVIRSKTDRALVLANRQLAGGFSEKINSIRRDLLEIMAHIEANIDFPEDDIPETDPEIIKSEIIKSKGKIEELIKNTGSSKILREGISTLILGRTNVGKSSLLNALLREERAIVTDVPGTTRDIIEEYINIKGIPVKVIDTAGIRETSDLVEKIGVERAKRYLKEAEMVLLIMDASMEITDEDRNIFEMVKDKFTIGVINKVDLPAKIDEKEVKRLLPGKKVIKISALKEQGIEELKNEIYNSIVEQIGPIDENTIIAGQRQKQALEAARNSLERAMESMKVKMPVEIIEIDIREAWEKLGEITGDTVSDDIINAIFENFCIGK